MSQEPQAFQTVRSNEEAQDLMRVRLSRERQANLIAL
jgi:hypothetical protein